MAFLERKWVLALGVLVLIVGFNGISGWMAAQGEKNLESIVPVQVAAAESSVTSPSVTEVKPAAVIVHVCGAVTNPGVFSLPEGSRVTDALKKAGGFSPKADTLSVNLAEVITDGQQIVIYEQSTDPQSNAAPSASKAKPAGGADSGLPVNINHGTLQALMLLDGIGEKTAQKIMDYRKAQGGFKSIEELKNVPGIGDKKFEKIKNDVRL